MSLPEPYYQDDHATIYHGDCLEILPFIDADVVVTDPPYGVDYNTDSTRFTKGKGGHKRTADRVHGDTEPFDPNFWAIWPRSFFGYNHFADKLKGGTCHVWDKTNGKTGNILADFEMWWTSWGSGPSSIRRITWNGSAREIEHGQHYHPTQKPVSLMAHVIGDRCPEGVILDPFMGSGTTLRAAKDLGRKSIGIEISERYCEIAANRLAQEVLDFNIGETK